MLKNMKRLLGLEKDSSFSTRVIILSLPSAVVYTLIHAQHCFTMDFIFLLCYHHFVQYVLAFTAKL